MSRSGLVALIGRPNVGKSTLLNHLVGEKVAIVSDKPQTTRHRILGVRTVDDTQLIFVDTPGIHRPGYRLNERMMAEVYQSLKEVDVLVQVVDASQRFGQGDRYVLDLVKTHRKPTLLVLNKVDLINKGKLLPMLESYGREYEYLEMIPLSAVQGVNVDVLEQKLVEQLAEQDWLFPSEYLTNQTEKTTIGEIIREKVLHYTRQELPYSTAVQVEAVREDDREQGFLHITASIIVDKPSQKKIVIGRGGRMVKVIGSQARVELEKLLDVRSIYLDLNVKVVPDWRNREHLLDELTRDN